MIELRDVTEADLPILFEHQRDAESNAMAAVPAREREAFDAHWKRLLADDSLFKKAIVVDGDVVGNAVSWPADGRRWVGYWIGREHWGKGYASAALARVLELIPERPLSALVAGHNGASRRVLEKCGFELVEEHRGEYAGAEIDELLFELR